MTVQPLAAAQAAAQTSASSSSSSSSQDNSLNNVNENEFLTLLVAQLKYQDPTNPTDSTAFVTQLAQFSSLEQLVGIRSDLDTLTQSASTTTNTSTTQGGQ